MEVELTLVLAPVRAHHQSLPHRRGAEPMPHLQGGSSDAIPSSNSCVNRGALQTTKLYLRPKQRKTTTNVKIATLKIMEKKPSQEMFGLFSFLPSHIVRCFCVFRLLWLAFYFFELGGVTWPHIFTATVFVSEPQCPRYLHHILLTSMSFEDTFPYKPDNLRGLQQR